MSTRPSPRPTPPPTMFNAAPDQLRELVLNYLLSHCYIKSASEFARETTVRALDADGDEVMLPDKTKFNELSAEELAEVDLRHKIHISILSGHADTAIELLETHFPAVLAPESSPTTKAASHYPRSLKAEHVSLNLRILSFTESCRTVPLPHSAESIPRKRTSENIDNGKDAVEQQTALLLSARKLYVIANMLPEPHRKIYLEELRDVSGLLAYQNPESSPVARYLSQERRDAVAEQVNAAILYHTSRSPISSIERHVRHTSAVWRLLHEMRVLPAPGATVPPSESVSKDKAVPLFSLPYFLDSKS